MNLSNIETREKRTHMLCTIFLKTYLFIKETDTRPFQSSTTSLTSHVNSGEYSTAHLDNNSNSDLLDRLKTIITRFDSAYDEDRMRNLFEIHHLIAKQPNIEGFVELLENIRVQFLRFNKEVIALIQLISTDPDKESDLISYFSSNLQENGALLLEEFFKLVKTEENNPNAYYNAYMMTYFKYIIETLKNNKLHDHALHRMPILGMLLQIDTFKAFFESLPAFSQQEYVETPLKFLCNMIHLKMLNFIHFLDTSIDISEKKGWESSVDIDWYLNQNFEFKNLLARNSYINTQLSEIMENKEINQYTTLNLPEDFWNMDWIKSLEDDENIELYFNHTKLENSMTPILKNKMLNLNDNFWKKSYFEVLPLPEWKKETDLGLDLKKLKYHMNQIVNTLYDDKNVELNIDIPLENQDESDKEIHTYSIGITKNRRYMVRYNTLKHSYALKKFSSYTEDKGELIASTLAYNYLHTADMTLFVAEDIKFKYGTQKIGYFWNCYKDWGVPLDYAIDNTIIEIDVEFIKTLAHDLLRAINHLRERDLIHGDIDIKNILVKTYQFEDRVLYRFKLRNLENVNYVGNLSTTKELVKADKKYELEAKETDLQDFIRTINTLIKKSPIVIGKEHGWSSLSRILISDVIKGKKDLVEVFDDPFFTENRPDPPCGKVENLDGLLMDYYTEAPSVDYDNEQELNSEIQWCEEKNTYDDERINRNSKQLIYGPFENILSEEKETGDHTEKIPIEPEATTANTMINVLRNSDDNMVLLPYGVIEQIRQDLFVTMIELIAIGVLAIIIILILVSICILRKKIKKIKARNNYKDRNAQSGELSRLEICEPDNERHSPGSNATYY